MLEENQTRLRSFTTFGIGGPARWFVEATSEDEIVEAPPGRAARRTAVCARRRQQLLVADAGFAGLVLHVGLNGHRANDGRPVLALPPAKTGSASSSRRSRADCAGIECLAGIPGTVGGTPVQNVGAYGQEVASVIERVRAFDLETRNLSNSRAAECGFELSQEPIQRDRSRPVHRDARRLPADPRRRAHAALRGAAAGDGSSTATEAARANLAEVAEAVRRIRRSKGMLLVEGDPDCRSAGSFFKNPMVSEELFQEIAAAVVRKMPPRFPAGTRPENGAG